MSGEIAAVHRRDVFRIERMQVACLVPVVEMPAETLHSIDVARVAIESLSTVSLCSEPAEITHAATTGKQIEHQYLSGMSGGR